MSQMLRASGAMAAATLASRLLGLAREMVYAAFMGNTWVATMFVLAFQVPNLFRRLLGEGALTAAFIPLFKKREAEQGTAAMWKCANAVISALLFAAGAITVAATVILTLMLIPANLTPERRLLFQLLRFMFPYMLLACLAAVLIGMANSRGHFFIPALGAAVLNLVMIASVWWLAPRMGKTLDQQIMALAIGVIIAGLAQVLFQLPTLISEGFRFRWVTPFKDPDVTEVVHKMIPGSIGVAAFQLNVLLIGVFSVFVDKTILSTFNYAVRLMELPQGLFGISLATYLLPTLSGLAARKEYPEFRRTLGSGLGHLAFANLAAAAVAFSLSEPIVRLLFERGIFDSFTTRRVALTLTCLAPGLLMFSTNNILARAFYALQDIKTPMRISLVCLGLNLALSFWLVWPLQEAGLAIANSLTSVLNSALLFYALKLKLKTLELAELRKSVLRLVGVAVAAAAIAWAVSRLWEYRLGHGSFLLKLGAVFVPMAVTGLSYWLLALVAKVPAASEMAQFARRRRS